MMHRVAAVAVALLALAALTAPFALRLLRPVPAQAVTIGRDGWLFPGWERRVEQEPDRTAAASNRVLATATELRSSGTRLVLVMVPLKARAHADKLPGLEASGGFVELAESLRSRGLEVLTTSPSFFSDDPHWTPEAAEAAAMQLAKLPSLPHGGRGAALGAWRTEYRVGDLAETLASQGGPRAGPSGRRVRAYMGPARGRPALMVVGNSFAADYLGFGPMLSNALGVSVATIVRERASGPWEAMEVYVAAKIRHPVVVWIIPEASFSSYGAKQ